MSFRLQASYVSKAHTICASSAFLCALLVALRLHYRKIVKNEVAGYPEEWWPSVSATIGDWYPERSIFQILIALTAGPRFALVFCWWLLTGHRLAVAGKPQSSSSILPHIVAMSGVARTLSCGGWVYITSSDDHDAHDVLMISYMVLNLPWMIGSIMCTPVASTLARRRRKLIATSFFLSICPLVYFFIQHKVHRVPGAYTKYSFLEWFLIFSDIWFDSVTASDFSVLEITVSHISVEASQSKNEPIIEPFGARSSVTNEVRPTRLEAPPSTNSHGGAKRAIPSESPRELAVRMPPFNKWFKVPSSLRQAATFAADVYLAYVWWSIFTSLAVTLFYFSVWQLAIAGQEISLISTLSPVFLGISSVRITLSSHKGRTWLHILSIIGLVAYKLEDPLHRLFAVAFANVCGALLKAIEWSDEKQAERHGLALALGLAISSLSKLLNHSNNPIWPIVNETSGGWNKTGVLLAVLAIWEYARRGSPDAVSLDQSAASVNPEQNVGISVDKSEAGIPSPAVAPDTGLLDHWLFASIGLGGLIFSLHCFLADPGTLLAMSWSGYPITGPVPGFHGYLTLMATGFGISIASSKAKRATSHPLWMIFGVMSAYYMYKWQDWPGYVAGLCVAMFLSSLITEIVRNSARHGKDSPGKVYFTAWLVVCLFDLANVWTVAYAFVPAGWILRERTDIVLAMQLVALGLGLIPGWRTVLSPPPRSSTKPSFRRYARQLSALLISAPFLITTYRFPAKIPMPYHADQRLITAGIWTVHFGIDNEGRDSQRRMRDLIKDMQLDVVGLLETDLQRIVFGNRDLTRVIAEDLGYHVDIGPGPNRHTWGAVLLSKFPILKSTHHLLPSPHGELAPAISAVLDVWGQNVTVIVSHNGQEEDVLDRELQSTELARIMASIYPDPVIFLGYVVSKPLAKRPNPYEILVTDGLMNDIEEEDWDRWCEYILYRGLYRVSYARVSRATITDTELQVGKFVLPKIGHPIVNLSREDRYLRSYREILHPSMWFPDEYLDKVNPGGKRGHFYHVHPWPLYYRLPDNAVV